MIKLCDLSNCTGCGACLNACKHGAICMKENIEGFLYPEINYAKCISCEQCLKSCPELNKDYIETQKNCVSKCYAAYAKNNNIRERSSSGGVFSVLANFVLNSNGIVIGAAMQNDFKLHHLDIYQIKDLTLLQGSKYLQSDTKNIFSLIRTALKNNKMVLFCGTPCQVAGLKTFLNKSKTDRLITCDFICHGVPSYIPLKKMIESSTKMKNTPTSQICFRNLRKWNSGIYLRKKIFKLEYLLPIKGIEEFYFKAYLGGYMNRECCYKCSYANTYRTSDITIADYWNIEPQNELTPNMINKGISFIGINSENGLKIINKVKDELFLQERSILDIKEKNEQFNHPAYRPTERDTFYRDLDRNTWRDLTTKYNYFPPKNSFLNTIRIYKNLIFSLKSNKNK